MPIEEDDRGTYLYNSRDLCMIGHLPELLDAGVTSLKVEGRMKTALYAATVARAYRLALDALQRDPEEYREKLPWFQAEVRKCTTRSFTTGFYFGKPGPEAQNYESSEYFKDYIYLGQLEEDEKGVFFLQKNKFSVGDGLELIRPDGSSLPFTVTGMRTADGDSVQDCPHPGQKLYLEGSISLQAFDLLRKENIQA